MSVNVCPAIDSVPVRAAVPAFAAMLNITVPPPLPLAPDMIVIHPVLLVAVQVQPGALEMLRAGIEADPVRFEKLNIGAVADHRENEIVAHRFFAVACLHHEAR